MLITFQTKAFASITMFGDVAEILIKLMGHSGAVPGVCLAEDVPDALVRLKASIETQLEIPLEPTRYPANDEDENDEPVSLTHRALPLIELLTAAAAEKENVMWEAS